VTCAITSLNKQLLFSGSKDMKVNVYEYSNEYQLKHSLVGHERAVTCVAVSKDDKYIISGSEDYHILIWYVSTGLNITKIKCCDNSITCLASYGTALSVITGTSSLINQLKIWEPNTGECIETMHGHTHAITNMLLTDDEKYLLTSSTDGTLRLWKTGTTDLLDYINFDSEVIDFMITKLLDDRYYKLVVLIHNGGVAFLHLHIPSVVKEHVLKENGRLKLVEDNRHQMDFLTPLRKKGCFCCFKYFT